LILGWDVAGVVEKVGPDVRHFNVGDEVYTRPDLGRNGGHAEYIAVKADEVALKPQSLSFAEAAALPLAGITAWEAVIERGRIGAGQRILIHAGSGGVGSLAIQLAKFRGAEVFTTTSASNADWVGELGADHVIDYQRQDFVEQAKGMDVVFDTIGGEIQGRSWRTLRPDGLLVSIVEPPDAKVAREAGARSAFVFIQPNADILREMASLVEAGRLRPVVDRLFPLSQARDAYAVSMSGRARGKLVFDR
jgi:NADPH:quinone reductase-like Zn-dependent oxidoreductase